MPRLQYKTNNKIFKPMSLKLCGQKVEFFKWLQLLCKIMRFVFLNSVCDKESNDIWNVLIWLYLHRNRLSDLSLIEFENGSATATKSILTFERLSPRQIAWKVWATCQRPSLESEYTFLKYTQYSALSDSDKATCRRDTSLERQKYTQGHIPSTCRATFVMRTRTSRILFLFAFRSVPKVLERS